LKTAPTLKPEDRISHYRVVGPLGAGGMGEVYRAHDESLERDVALKILPSELVRDEGRVRRFIKEAKAASSLSHPHIVTIHEIGQAEVGSTTVHFIAMELVRGDTLRHLIHGEKTALRPLLRYLAQAADGLATAHAAGIVHRDLKPDNIMVTKDGFAKVLDFGLAKLTEPKVPVADLSDSPTATLHKTGEGVVLGTIGYMSPEQVQGKPVDQRSDIFSFGCILYEAATRRRPFAGDSSIETMHKILKDKPAPIEELNAEAPAELRRLIRRCLSKSPDERHHSMKDIAIELQDIVDEYDALSASGSSGSGKAPIAPAKPRRPIVPVLAILGVVAVVSLLVGIWVRRDGSRKTNAAFQSIKMTTLRGPGDVSSAAISPDGRYLASAGHGSVRVRQVSAGRDVEVFHGSTPPDMLRFAPDGEHLFFVSPVRHPPVNALYEIPCSAAAPPSSARHTSI
jgi:serine/threonine protein kinase